MAAVSRHAHDRALRFGLYTNMGPTMGGDGSLAPGLNCSSGLVAECPQAKADIAYFAEALQIDYLKVDADDGGVVYNASEGGRCGSQHVRAYNASYPLVSRLLAQSGRDVMLYCSWPVATSKGCGWPLQYELMARHCGAVKQYYDVQDTWGSVQSIIEYWARGSMLWAPPPGSPGTPHLTGNLRGFLDAARPGSWNMPDQLVVGQTPCKSRARRRRRRRR